MDFPARSMLLQSPSQAQLARLRFYKLRLAILHRSPLVQHLQVVLVIQTTIVSSVRRPQSTHSQVQPALVSGSLAQAAIPSSPSRMVLVLVTQLPPRINLPPSLSQWAKAQTLSTPTTVPPGFASGTSNARDWFSSRGADTSGSNTNPESGKLSGLQHVNKSLSGQPNGAGGEVGSINSSGASLELQTSVSGGHSSSNNDTQPNSELSHQSTDSSTPSTPFRSGESLSSKATNENTIDQPKIQDGSLGLKNAPNPFLLSDIATRAEFFGLGNVNNKSSTNFFRTSSKKKDDRGSSIFGVSDRSYIASVGSFSDFISSTDASSSNSGSSNLSIYLARKAPVKAVQALERALAYLISRAFLQRRRSLLGRMRLMAQERGHWYEGGKYWPGSSSDWSKGGSDQLRKEVIWLTEETAGARRETMSLEKETASSKRDAVNPKEEVASPMESQPNSADAGKIDASSIDKRSKELGIASLFTTTWKRDVDQRDNATCPQRSSNYNLEPLDSLVLFHVSIGYWRYKPDFGSTLHA